jgi:hypothetical protein
MEITHLKVCRSSLDLSSTRVKFISSRLVQVMVHLQSQQIQPCDVPSSTEKSAAPALFGRFFSDNATDPPIEQRSWWQKID